MSSKISENLIPRIRELESQGYVHLRMKRYKDAEKAYEKISEILTIEQEKTKKRIHKGAPLHMVGVSFLFQEDLENAIHYFLLAYAEDTLNVGILEEDLADRYPAGRMLADIFRIESQFLVFVKEIAQGIKKEGRDDSILDPEEILSRAIAMRTAKLPGLSIIKKYLDLCSGKPRPPSKRSVNNIPGSWGKRVFIGGNYDHMATLMEIKEIMLSLNYEPIIALEFDIPEDKIHHHDLMLLHNCKYAVFDVSQSDGHLMEIERTRDYDVKTLLVYSARDEKRHPPSSMSTMIKTLGIQMIGYLSSNELKQLISRFLSP